MKKAFVNSMGKLTWVLDNHTGEDPVGFTGYDVSNDVTANTHYFDGTTIQAYSPEQLTLKSTPPMFPANWNDSIMAWVDLRSLSDARIAADQRINQAKFDANSKFNYEGKEFATDVASRNEIEGINGYVAIRNVFPEDWVGGWKSIDNTYLELTTVPQWQNFYTAMVSSNTLNYVKAQALKAMIGTTTTVEEADAISWDTEVG